MVNNMTSVSALIGDINQLDTENAQLKALLHGGIDALIAKNARLKLAIAKHRDGFLGEPKNYEHALWKVLDNA